MHSERPEEQFVRAAVKLAESLLWRSRARQVNPLITKVSIAFEGYFQAQSRFFFRKVWPQIMTAALAESGVIEAPRKPVQGALTNAQIDKALATLDSFADKVAATAVDEAVSSALNLGAAEVSSGTGLPITFNLKSEAALDYLKAHAGEKLGQDVTQTTKNRVRSVLVKGFDKQIPFSQMKSQIRDLYSGFSARSAQSFTSNRAENIAVTEVGNAYSEGSLQQAAQLQAAGTDMEKAWALAADPCPICEPNGDDGWIEIDEPFSSGDDRPLAHPTCRCSLLVRVKPSNPAD